MAIKILVPTDFSSISEYALEYGAFLATVMSAEITALHLVDGEKYHNKSEFQKDVARMVEEEFEPELKRIKKGNPGLRNIHVQLKAFVESAAEEISDFARQQHFDYIIIGSHAEEQDRDWFESVKGTNAYQVLHSAPCPVVTFFTPRYPVQLNSILLPLDLTPGTLQKIPQAIKLAQWFGASIHLMSVCPSNEDNDYEFLQEQLTTTSDKLKSLGMQVSTELQDHDDLPGTILTYANGKGMDMIVIMTKPSASWNEAFTSTNAKRIVSGSTIPVMGIRPWKQNEIGV